MRMLTCLLAFLLVWLPPSVVAHSGRTNGEGCHNDHKNGGYHCHRAPARPAPTGRLVPAPPQKLAPQQARPTASPVRYANCNAARAAGAAPVYRGDPGYGPHLDRDNDGVGCEPYRDR